MRASCQIDNKKADIYISGKKEKTIVLLTFGNEGQGIYELVSKQTSKPFNLIILSQLNWNDDLTPWPSQPIIKGGGKYGGFAGDFLKSLISNILPKIVSDYDLDPSAIALCGYSLAGLFSLYAGYRTNLFSALLSVSGSLWYPGFSEFATTNELSKNVSYVYLSLGKKESETRNQVMKAVGMKTELLAHHYQTIGVDFDFVWNEGGHFDDPIARQAKAILRFLDQEAR